MAKKKKRLCSNCRTTRDNVDVIREPPHLVHPSRRVRGLFDISGNAECPECGALWHRGPRGMKLVG